MSESPEFHRQNPTAAIILDSVLDCMTTLAADIGRLEEFVVFDEQAQNAQRLDELTSELSALALTLAEAQRRVSRCTELYEEDS